MPLTKIYKLLGVASRDRCIVTFAAMTFFKRAFRGNSVSKRCSGWRLRKRASVNTSLLQLLTHLYKTHEEYFKQVTKIISTKASEQTVQVELTATFELSTDQSKELMQIMFLITEAEKERDDEGETLQGEG
jgi:F0F1-type ATP synthase delta subunit